MKKLLAPLSQGLIISLVVLALMLLGNSFLDLMELKAEDAMFRFRGSRPEGSGQVAVVAVDEYSLDKVGRWPWPRERLAQLLGKVAGMGPKVIGLDMGFFEPERRLDVAAVVEVTRAAREGKPLELEEVITRFHPDYLLAQALAESPCPVVLGYFFHMDAAEMAHLSPEEAAERKAALERFALKVVTYASPQAMDRELLRAFLPEPNQPLIAQATEWAGFYNVVPGGDGVVRGVPLIMQCGDAMFPSLVLAMLAVQTGGGLPQVRVNDAGLDGITVGDVHLPTDHKGRLRVDFLGRGGVVPRISAAKVLAGAAPPDALKGKAVLISVTATGVHDMRPTPVDRLLPGVFIHAQALDNALSGQFLVRSSMTALLDMAGVLALGLGAALALALLPPLAGGMLTVLMGAGYVGLGYGMFLDGKLLDLVHPLLALLGSGVAVTLYRYLGEERQRRFVRNAFQHYLSPQVIDQLIADPEALKLGGEKKEVTILFADIRGFTSLAEKLEPELLSQVLNMLLDRLTQAVLDAGGLVDKFIGDAVMAIFGAPLEQPDHAARSCRAALAMTGAVRALLPEWERRGVPPLTVGVGLNTGGAVVGNMGSSTRFDYTVIGDNVNLASRLEGQTRVYGVDVVVSQAVREEAGEAFCFRALDVIRVKGRQMPVKVHELLGTGEGYQPKLGEMGDQALERYLERDFAGALELLEKILHMVPGDPPSQLLAQRCRRYLQTPPDQDWDGVETRTSK